jgi:hypothetical protein
LEGDATALGDVEDARAVRGHLVGPNVGKPKLDRPVRGGLEEKVVAARDERARALDRGAISPRPWPLDALDGRSLGREDREVTTRETVDVFCARSD